MPRVQIHLQNTPLKEAINQIEKQTGVHVYYRDEWISAVQVNVDLINVPADSALILTLGQFGLKVSRWNGNLVILPGKKLIGSLPAYSNRVIETGQVSAEESSATEAEERYLSGRKPGVIDMITIGAAVPGKLVKTARIKGLLTDQSSGEPLPGATMYIQETGAGAVSDLSGNVFISLKPGMYTVQFECLGMEKKKVQFQVFSDGTFGLELSKSVIPIEEIVVKGGMKRNITATDPGLEKINVKSVKELPVMLGDRDILKISEMLPGIVTVGEGSAGLNVRGGSADQNMFYINKVPVYNTSHLFGFFSAFNSDIIKDFSIYKGHVPAEYGGRLSSVFNIVTRQGNRKQLMARGGINPVTANFTMEGPIKKEALTFVLSGRSSYSDWILSRINDPQIRSSSASFYDISGSLTYDVKAKNQVSLFYYRSADQFRFADINQYAYSNDGTSLNWKHLFSNYFKGELALITSGYSFTTSDTKSKSQAYTHAYSIRHNEVRADFSLHMANNNTLEAGANGILYLLDRGNVNPYNNESLRIPTKLGKESGIESAVYLSDNYDPFRWLNLNLGVRYVLFAPLGSRDVYLYDPTRPMEALNIIDTLHFTSGQTLKKYSGPEVRAAVNFHLSSGTSFKVSFNQMQQYLFMLSNTVAIAPNSQWKLADYHLRPSKANQLSAGLYQEIPTKGLELSCEVFGKETRDFTEFKDGADFIQSPLVETSVLQGKQLAYGVECMVRKEGGKLDGWLAYTYSRSLVTVDGVAEWQKINEGNTYPANFDIPNVFTAVGSYHFTRRLTLASNITYQTGKPVTYPKSIYLVDGGSYLDYSNRNQYRIPDYFRIDVSLTLEGNLLKKKPVHSSWMFNVYNMTGRKNAYSVFFDSQNGVVKGNKYSVIGTPIFMLTWQFKFGNYATD